MQEDEKKQERKDKEQQRLAAEAAEREWRAKVYALNALTRTQEIAKWCHEGR